MPDARRLGETRSRLHQHRAGTLVLHLHPASDHVRELQAAVVIVPVALRGPAGPGADHVSSPLARGRALHAEVAIFEIAAQAPPRELGARRVADEDALCLSCCRRPFCLRHRLPPRIHSGSIPASLTISAYALISDSTVTLNSAGELPTGSRPCAARRSRSCRFASAAPTSPESFARMSDGTPAGTNRPNQPASISIPRTPASASVGTSGRYARRECPVTPSARSLPALMWASASEALANITWISPPSSAATAGPPPLYGT